MKRNKLSNLKILMQLTKNDFQKRYIGSYLGVIWAFIQPTITILIFWFVFQVGFKSPPVNDVPYILWLSTGLVPWFFFSDSINSAAGSVIESSFLVKKVIFRVEMLPLIKIMSALFVHLFFVLIIFVLFSLYGYTFIVYYLQILYYLPAMMFLMIGLSWLTSSLSVFLKDVSHFVNMVLQFGFWLTPIFWNISIIPEEYKSLLIYNPMFYIVEGYRDTFFNYVWFWEKPELTYCFWAISTAIFILGRVVFMKLKPHFADVL